MPLPTSGTITLNEIHVEAGGASGSQASINDADIRGLLSPTPASGSQMDFADWHGASNIVYTSYEIRVYGSKGGTSGTGYCKGGYTTVTYQLGPGNTIQLRPGGIGANGGGNFGDGAGGGGGSAGYINNTLVAVGGGGGGGIVTVGTEGGGGGGNGFGQNKVGRTAGEIAYGGGNGNGGAGMVARNTGAAGQATRGGNGGGTPAIGGGGGNYPGGFGSFVLGDGGAGGGGGGYGGGGGGATSNTFGYANGGAGGGGYARQSTFGTTIGDAIYVTANGTTNQRNAAGLCQIYRAGVQVASSSSNVNYTTV